MAPTAPAPTPAGAPAGSPSPSVSPPPPWPGQDAEEPELAYESDLPQDDDDQPDETGLDRNPPSGTSQAPRAAAQPSDGLHCRTASAERGSAATLSRAVTTGGLVVLGALVVAAAVALSRASRRHQDSLQAAPLISAAGPALPARASVNRWWRLLMQFAPVLLAWLPARGRRRAPAIHEPAETAPPLSGVLRRQG